MTDAEGEFEAQGSDATEPVGHCRTQRKTYPLQVVIPFCFLRYNRLVNEQLDAIQVLTDWTVFDRVASISNQSDIEHSTGIECLYKPPAAPAASKQS